MNVLGPSNRDWVRRSELLARVLPGLEADIVALQEVPTNDGFKAVRKLIGDEFQIRSFRRAAHDGIGGVLATRWSMGNIADIDQWVTPRSRTFPWCASVVVDLETPLGLVTVAHHKPSWQFGFEVEREMQAVRLARELEERASTINRHVLVIGDFDAEPQASSSRFLRGRQSLEGVSVYYQDAWETNEFGDGGATFSGENPLVAAGEVATALSRRIDHILVRGGDHGPTLRVVDCRRVLDGSGADGVWASDHFGVMADLAIPDHAPGSWDAAASPESLER